MGNYATATICFGIVLKNKDGEPLEDLSEIIPVSKNEKGFEFIIGICKALKKQYPTSEGLRKLEESYPLEIVHYGSSDGWSGLILAAKDSLEKTDWSRPEIIFLDFEQTCNWRNDILNFCNANGIPFSEPRYLLSAHYG